MATKKAKLERPAQKPTREPATRSSAARDMPDDDDVRRLLRTAAWSRMFGRVTGAKNPFSR